MKIEIAVPNHYSQSGKSLLRLIQNNDMPTLDLLVRESIQNSLDAWNKEKKSKNVLLEINVGQFFSNDLAYELDGITNGLIRRYGDDLKDFIAISDSNTYGLTGEIEDPDGDGNLQKLIYQICKAQEGEGAGGSWGIGKTVYFRVGMGLVIYYSRVQLENGNYQSRLAASLVEDESGADTLIPQYKDFKPRGAAWWGKKVAENATVPITDDKEINCILSIFGLKPYEGDKTGTTVIIPYVDQKRLLHDNMVDYYDSLDNKLSIVWRKQIADYIKIAIQRWYAPRLNNMNYPYGPYLRVKINGEDLGGMEPTDGGIEPFFQFVQALYNRASVGQQICGDILSDKEYNVETIKVRNVFVDGECSGKVSFVKVSKADLGMIPPLNKYAPLVYINKEDYGKDANKPIVCFTRRPGMIVSYENVSEWTDGIPSVDKEHYIIAVFVLNSENKLKDEYTGISLDEYVRQSELADHTSWSDINIKSKNLRIVSRIKKNTASKVGKAFEEKVVETKTDINSGYSRYFGEMLLPPENFGKKATKNGGGLGKDNKITIKHKNVILQMRRDTTKYSSSGVSIGFLVKTRTPIKYLLVDVLASLGENGKYSVPKWEDITGTKVPFNIEKVEITFESIGNEKKLAESCLLDNNAESSFRDLEIKNVYSPAGTCHGFEITSDQEQEYSFIGVLHLSVTDYNLMTTVNVDTKRGQ